MPPPSPAAVVVRRYRLTRCTAEAEPSGLITSMASSTWVMSSYLDGVPRPYDPSVVPSGGAAVAVPESIATMQDGHR